MKTPIFGPQVSPLRPGRVLLGLVPAPPQSLALAGLAGSMRMVAQEIVSRDVHVQPDGNRVTVGPGASDPSTVPRVRLVRRSLYPQVSVHQVSGMGAGVRCRPASL